MLDEKINILHITQIAKSLTNKDFLRYYMELQGDLDIFYLKPYFIERFGEKFLEYVMKGNQKATKAILRLCPEILSYRGNIHLRNRPVRNRPVTNVLVLEIIQENIDILDIINVSALELIQENTDILDIILSIQYEMKDEDNLKIFGNALLYYAIRGNQEAVVKLLRYCPALLKYRGNVIDYSGREFKNVTAFELVTWALDVKHMAPAMLNCLIDNEELKELAPELQQQFANVVKDGGGVNYTIGCGLLNMSEDPRTLLQGRTDEERYVELNQRLNRYDGLIQYQDKLFYFHNLKSSKKLVEITNPDAVNALKGLMKKEERELEVDKLQIINNDDELKMIQQIVPDSRHIFKEKHYDFTPLLSALDVLVHSFDDSTWTCPQRDAHYCTIVGLAQHYVPAHVAQHYCNPDESFDPQYNGTPPTFKEEVLRRVLEFYNWVADKKECWWFVGAVASPILDSARGSGPGLNFGVLRGRIPQSAEREERLCLQDRRLLTLDLAAITALCKVRTDDALELKQLLDRLEVQVSIQGSKRIIKEFGF